MMTTAESFEWALLVAEAELIGETATKEEVSKGTAQIIEGNVLLYPKMLATLRKLGVSDLAIASAMIDPHKFADEFCEGLGDE